MLEILSRFPGRILRHHSFGLILASILAVGLLARLWALHFGLPAINDPDELVFQLGAVKMLREGTLNPGWFGHPATTTLYLLAMLDAAVFGFGHLTGWFPSIQAFGDAIYHDPSWVMLPARSAMALFGVACVYLTCRLGSELFDRRVGLLAAALLAVSPIHVTYSQVVRSDIMATAFLLLMLLATLRYGRARHPRDLIAAAIWFGFTTTTKWPFAACAASFGAVVLLPALIDHESLGRAFGRLAAFALTGIVAVLVISPYLALDYQTALKGVMSEAQVYHVGANGKGTVWNAGWYLRVPLRHALGIPGLGLVGLGMVIAARRREAGPMLLPLILVLSAVTVTQNLIWARWVLPLLPLLCLLAAAAAFAGYDRTTAWKPVERRILFGIALIILFAPLLFSLRADATERLNDTRQAATRWADTNLPPGSRIIVEHFGFDLLSRPWSYLFPLADAGCVDARALLQGKVQYAAIEAMRGGHHNVDYGTLTPTMRPTCTADYAILSQYDRYQAEAPIFPSEIKSYQELLARSTLLTTIYPQAGKMGGPIIRILRIDRPYSHPQAPQQSVGAGAPPHHSDEL